MSRRQTALLPTLRVTAPVATLAIAVTGAVFFGTFSCAGYVWHSDLFWALLLACLTFATLLPIRALRSVPQRIAFIATVLAAFFVIRGAASTFYPAPPESWTDFGHGTWLGILYGPC
jgi:uncharacterized membrane protein (UPF0136 family)